MIARLITLLVLAIAIYFGISGSWTTAILFFLFYGGLEFTLYSFDSTPAEDEGKP
jgi:mannose/fructose/N-acetylgalactosamine-specific phosphotransferase system component IID